MPIITNIKVQGDIKSYDFLVTKDAATDEYVATCDQPNGGLCTVGSHASIIEMVLDCVETWELPE